MWNLTRLGRGVQPCVSTRPAALAKRSAIRRDEPGVSQARLVGLESGVYRNYIGGIERADRRPTIATAAKLATTLGTRPTRQSRDASRAARARRGRQRRSTDGRHPLVLPGSAEADPSSVRVRLCEHAGRADQWPTRGIAKSDCCCGRGNVRGSDTSRLGANACGSCHDLYAGYTGRDPRRTQVPWRRRVLQSRLQTRIHPLRLRMRGIASTAPAPPAVAHPCGGHQPFSPRHRFGQQPDSAAQTPLDRSQSSRIADPR